MKPNKQKKRRIRLSKHTIKKSPGKMQSAIYFAGICSDKKDLI